MLITSGPILKHNGPLNESLDGPLDGPMDGPLDETFDGPSNGPKSLNEPAPVQKISEDMGVLRNGLIILFFQNWIFHNLLYFLNMSEEIN